MIYDYIDSHNWTSDVDDWEDEFDKQDLVIGPGYGSFRTMFVVHEIDPSNTLDKVTHKGVFWDEMEAKAYAKDRHDRTHNGDNE